MPWLKLVEAFVSGFALANFVPHFVNGISGNPFPTPFANPPGKGLSSPLLNTVWGLLFLVIGALLFHGGNVASGETASLVAFFAGIVVLSTTMSVHFASKHKE